ncbi:MAG: hypothetical protein L0H83_05665 [Salinisphaera sp.]|nr:hypothetical protein [Salinisphaera sp.]
MNTAALSLLAVVISGCACTPETVVKTVTVREPVYVRPEPPAWLLAPLFPAGAPVIFVDADSPDAVLGVTRDGLTEFWRAIDVPVHRLQQWRAWAKKGEK